MNLDKYKKDLQAMLKGFSKEQMEILASFYCNYTPFENIKDSQAKRAAYFLELIWEEDKEILKIAGENDRYHPKVLIKFINRICKSPTKLSEEEQKFLEKLRNDEDGYFKSTEGNW